MRKGILTYLEAFGFVRNEILFFFFGSFFFLLVFSK